MQHGYTFLPVHSYHKGKVPVDHTILPEECRILKILILLRHVGKKRKLDDAICNSSKATSELQQSTVHGTEPTESELEDLFHDLSCGGTKPLVLSLVPQYSDSYVPKSSLEIFPRDLYYKLTAQSHSNLQIADSGLVISTNWPFIGASPDGIVGCDCHGKGVVEIKCPYCHKGSSVVAAAQKDPKFCLKEIDGCLCLDTTHSYYYQV